MRSSRCSPGTVLSTAWQAMCAATGVCCTTDGLDSASSRLNCNHNVNQLFERGIHTWIHEAERDSQRGPETRAELICTSACLPAPIRKQCIFQGYRQESKAVETVVECNVE